MLRHDIRNVILSFYPSRYQTCLHWNMYVNNNRVSFFLYILFYSFFQKSIPLEKSPHPSQKTCCFFKIDNMLSKSSIGGNGFIHTGSELVFIRHSINDKNIVIQGSCFCMTLNK